MNRKKSALALSFLLAFSLFFSSCAHNSSAISGDIISQKVSDPDKTQLTILVKYAFSINGFEEAVEAKFPDIDIVQIGNYTSNMGTDEYYARLKNDDLPDIVMTWPLDVGREFWEDRLIDLSGMSFTSKYNLSMLDDISSSDGNLYYLPGPSQIRGIVYNKTLFDEKGWALPKNFDEFVELCKTIEADGIRSLQLGFKDSEVIDTAFIGYGIENCFSTPQDHQWIKNFNKGIGSSKEHLGPAIDTFQYMIDQGIWKKSDLEVTYAEREKMFFSRQCAMIEDSNLIASYGNQYSETNDTFALMPFFNPGEDSDWARLYMVCFVGLNKHLQEPENSDKYEKALKVMEYISTPDGQEALMLDTGAMLSSLNNMPLPSIPEIEPLIPTLSKGRCLVFPQLKNSQEAMRTGLTGLLKGEYTKNQVLQMIDTQNAKFGAESLQDAPIGTATDNFSLVDTGSFISDRMREAANTDFALFLDNGMDGTFNGKGVSAKLYKGNITKSDIKRILPDYKNKEKGNISKISVTGENLKNILEYALPASETMTGWFYYFSGLRLEFDPTAVPGKRIKSIITEGGDSIDLAKTYTVAIDEGSVDLKYVSSHEETSLIISDILIEYILNSKNISPAKDDRLVVKH